MESATSAATFIRLKFCVSYLNVPGKNALNDYSLRTQAQSKYTRGEKSNAKTLKEKRRSCAKNQTPMLVKLFKLLKENLWDNKIFKSLNLSDSMQPIYLINIKIYS